MTVSFTQYLLPNGRKSPVEISLSEPVEKMAHELIERGHRFECEMLSDYSTVSFTISAIDPDEPDVAITLCKNGPTVPGKIEEMITKFYKGMGEE